MTKFLQLTAKNSKNRKNILDVLFDKKEVKISNVFKKEITKEDEDETKM